ncbi:MAG TPA: helix-turn-helix domain-containing protein [Pseudonocardiaceae bacterium]|nr:helix-turn-helix domain-containing protein [Pseudonocardiaceae bacterium]
MGDAAKLWDIAVPAGPGRLPGLTMAGFTGRADELVDLRVIPFPAVTLFLDFGDALVIDDASGQRRSGSGVLGIAPRDIRARGQAIECLQLRLSPVLAHAVLRPCAELDGAVVALADIWGPGAEQVQDRLRAAASWEERFALAEATLAARAQAGRAVDPEVAFCWWQMVSRQGQVRIDALADEAGWSRKRLWARFRDQIGLTPKRAAQLVRFDRAAHRLAAGNGAALVAAEAGYADQSHLHREALAFAGLTPTGVAAAPWLAVDDIAWATR